MLERCIKRRLFSFRAKVLTICSKNSYQFLWSVWCSNRVSKSYQNEKERYKFELQEEYQKKLAN